MASALLLQAVALAGASSPSGFESAVPAPSEFVLVGSVLVGSVFVGVVLSSPRAFALWAVSASAHPAASLSALVRANTAQLAVVVFLPPQLLYPQTIVDLQRSYYTTKFVAVAVVRAGW